MMLAAFKRLGQSSKFWLAILSSLIPVLNQKFNLGLNIEAVIATMVPFMVCIFGTAWEDSKKTGNTATTGTTATGNTATGNTATATTGNTVTIDD